MERWRDGLLKGRQSANITRSSRLFQTISEIYIIRCGDDEKAMWRKVLTFSYFGLRPLNWMVTVLTVVMRETDPVQTKRERIRSLDIFHSFSKRHRMGSQRLEVFFSWIVNTSLRKVKTIAREVMQLEIFFFGISCFLPLFKNDVIDNRHVNCLSTLECEGTLRYSWY